MQIKQDKRRANKSSLYLLLIALPQICFAEYSAHRLTDLTIQFGDRAVNVGDLNDDDVNDIAVSSYTYDGDKGIVRIFSGANRTVIGNLYGDNFNDRFGFQIAGLGDVNNDGVSDFAVAAPKRTSTCPGGASPSPASNYQGYVRVFSGVDRQAIYTLTGLTNRGFGFALSAIGDQNSDGKPDFLVGAPYGLRDSDACSDYFGSIHVYSGSNGNLIRTNSSGPYNTYFGLPIGNVGDVNADGVEDYVGLNAGASTRFFILYSGYNGSILATVLTYPTIGGAGFGYVSGIGDITNDGRAEFAVSEQPSDSSDPFAGSVKIYSFPNSSISVVTTLQELGPNEGFGYSVAGLGDVNDDSVPDFGVLASGVGSKGYVKIFSGANFSVLATLFQGEKNPNVNLGEGMIAPAGFVDDDEIPDFIVTAPSSLADPINNGPAFLMLSNTPAFEDDLFKGSFFNIGPVVTYF